MKNASKSIEKNKFKLLILFLIFIVTIKTESISNFKAIYLSGNYYFVVNATNIFYYLLMNKK